MSASPSAVGARAEIEVATALIRAGKQVFLPLCASHGRADLAFEDSSGIYRVQCKTSRRLNENVLVFSTCSNTGGQRKDYQGEVEYFGVYSPELDRVFLIPARGLPRRACHLRLGPARNGQQKRLRWAGDFTLAG